MKCPGCNKFVSYEGDEEPEITSDPELAEDGAFSFEVRLVKRSACCGEELKETTFSFEEQVNPDWWAKNVADQPDPADIAVEVTQTEEGGGRYVKTYYGVDAVVQVVAPNGNEWGITLSERIAASYMDEL